MSSSSTSVEVGRYFYIELIDMDPPCCGSSFRNLFAKAVLLDGSTHLLAKYNKRIREFIVADSIPSTYKNRLRMDEKKIGLAPVILADEGTMFYMQYFYDVYSVESTYVELKTVNGM